MNLMGAGDVNFKATMDGGPCTITQRTAPIVPKNNVHNNVGTKSDYKAHGGLLHYSFQSALKL